MTNQLNITHQSSNVNWTRFWLFSKLFLSFLIITTIFSSLNYVISAFLILNILLGLLFMAAIFFIKFKTKKTEFVKITENKLQYFCQVKKEVILIPINEITNVRSHFCELEIHTYNRTYCINLNPIKEEKQRWEIKEMIKRVTVEKSNRAVIL